MSVSKQELHDAWIDFNIYVAHREEGAPLDWKTVKSTVDKAMKKLSGKELDELREAYPKDKITETKAYSKVRKAFLGDFTLSPPEKGGDARSESALNTLAELYLKKVHENGSLRKLIKLKQKEAEYFKKLPSFEEPDLFADHDEDTLEEQRKNQQEVLKKHYEAFRKRIDTLDSKIKVNTDYPSFESILNQYEEYMKRVFDHFGRENYTEALNPKITYDWLTKRSWPATPQSVPQEDQKKVQDIFVDFTDKLLRYEEIIHRVSLQVQRKIDREAERIDWDSVSAKDAESFEKIQEEAIEKLKEFYIGHFKKKTDSLAENSGVVIMLPSFEQFITGFDEQVGFEKHSALQRDSVKEFVDSRLMPTGFIDALQGRGGDKSELLRLYQLLITHVRSFQSVLADAQENYGSLDDLDKLLNKEGLTASIDAATKKKNQLLTAYARKLEKALKDMAEQLGQYMKSPKIDTAFARGLLMHAISEEFHDALKSSPTSAKYSLLSHMGGPFASVLNIQSLNKMAQQRIEEKIQRAQAFNDEDALRRLKKDSEEQVRAQIVEMIEPALFGSGVWEIIEEFLGKYSELQGFMNRIKIRKTSQKQTSGPEVVDPHLLNKSLVEWALDNEKYLHAMTQQDTLITDLAMKYTNTLFRLPPDRRTAFSQFQSRMQEFEEEAEDERALANSIGVPEKDVRETMQLLRYIFEWIKKEKQRGNIE